MADPTIMFLENLRRMGIDLDGYSLKEGTRLLTQLTVELEVQQVIGAGRYERSENRKLTAIVQVTKLAATATGIGPGNPGSGRFHSSGDMAPVPPHVT